MERKHIEAEFVAEAYLALLKDRGVNRLFVNAGTDFASIVEAYGHQKESGLDFPEVIVCAHENLATSMAHGTYLGNGQPQAVMLHTSVGTANAVCAIFNASRDRIPIILTAGRTPLFEHSVFGSRNGQIHWAQEMFDQASMVREHVKWDYELRDGVQVEAVVDRAIDVAMIEPRGPVYLSLPREVLARPVGELEIWSRGPAQATDAYPTPDSVTELADLLAAARFPVIVTAASGADTETVALLNELCTANSIAVLENRPRFMNVAGDHPLHLGYALNTVFEQADVLCFLDMDVPWSPGAANPKDDATVVQTGPDPIFLRFPIRSHRSDLTIQATTRNLLSALAPALEERRAKIDVDRYERIAELVNQRRARQAATLEAESTKTGPITKAFIAWAVRETRPEGAIIVNELGAPAETLASTEAGTYFDTPPAGGLGWGLPAALGLQLARPDKVVVAMVGDGSYIFANPAACHHAMAMHDLPVLTIISNNGKWGAVEASARGMYPEGYASAAGELTPLARLDPASAFEKYAEAAGGYGEFVAERAQLVPALRRALRVVQEERRHAVLNVECG
jgi:acetolactate synthase-1/2/3 large subunit